MSPVEELFALIEKENLWDREICIERNEILKPAGKRDTSLYFVVQGSLRIYVVDESEEHTIRFGYRKDFIMALDSFITEKPSELIIQALKKTKLKVISKEKYLNFIKSNRLIELWEILLSGLILQQMERERDILTISPAKRYQRVLKRSPELFQEIPHKYIASYLRMTPETLSRLKKS